MWARLSQCGKVRVSCGILPVGRIFTCSTEPDRAVTHRDTLVEVRSLHHRIRPLRRYAAKRRHMRAQRWEACDCQTIVCRFVWIAAKRERARRLAFDRPPNHSWLFDEDEQLAATSALCLHSNSHSSQAQHRRASSRSGGSDGRTGHHDTMRSAARMILMRARLDLEKPDDSLGPTLPIVCVGRSQVAGCIELVQIVMRLRMF